MQPSETGRQYDAIASWWETQQQSGRTTGLRFVRRAIDLSTRRSKALDVGCGTGSVLIDALTGAGFDVVGLDVSAGMLAKAVKRHPDVQFIRGDICVWDPPGAYDAIVAWDSIFHVPKASQGPVVEKLCDALAVGGVLLFTAGDLNGEITGEMEGRTFYYSSLDVTEYLAILRDHGCICALMERDQYPEHHVVFIGIKIGKLP